MNLSHGEGSADQRFELQLTFYRILTARIRHLLPHVDERGGVRQMDARRTRAQLDALLCHLLARLERAECSSIEAIARSLLPSDLTDIQTALRDMADQDPHPMTFRFHYLVVVSSQPRPAEKDVPEFGLHISSAPRDIPMRWYRFDADSRVHPLIRAAPQLCFEVSDLNSALIEADVILGPLKSAEGLRLAVAADRGAPVQLFEKWIGSKHMCND